MLLRMRGTSPAIKKDLRKTMKNGVRKSRIIMTSLLVKMDKDDIADKLRMEMGKIREDIEWLKRENSRLSIGKEELFKRDKRKRGQKSVERETAVADRTLEGV